MYGRPFRSRPGYPGPYYSGAPCSGALVYWCTGVLVYWCTGVLVHWCTGALVYWALVQYSALVQCSALMHWCIYPSFPLDPVSVQCTWNYSTLYCCTIHNYVRPVGHCCEHETVEHTACCLQSFPLDSYRGKLNLLPWPTFKVGGSHIM